MDSISYQRERWDEIWPEVEPLAREHFELDNPPGSAKHGRFELDLQQMQALDASGQFLIFTARKNGLLGGYSSWTIASDIECKGLLLANQGPLFMRRGYGSGLRLYRMGLEELKKLGVSIIYPYHRLGSPSRRLGKYFSRLGAQIIKAEYELRIGGDSNA